MTKPDAETEKKLISACIGNNQKAQKKLFDTYAPVVYSTCLRYGKNEDNAKDLLQESFIRVFQNLPSFKFEGSFEGWIRRIGVNTCIEFYRKELRIPESTHVEEHLKLSVDAEILDELKVADLMSLVRQLPPGYKAVFNMFVVEGFSHEEIAKHFDISINTSKTQLFKARAYLQELLLKVK
jgi:RNA polymerase sigma-70 factor (ECF subfamily)